MRNTGCVETLLESDTMVLVTPHPPLQVPYCRQQVTFLVVAVTMREHEVMSQVDRIPRPWNEVVDVGPIR
jgi:hypothetical protein